MTPEELTGWGTVGLVIFGLIQLAVTVLGERSRKREHEAEVAAEIARDDRAREHADAREKMQSQEIVDTARATIHAEWFRLWTTSKRWSEEDLIEAVARADFDPSDILPRDWGATTERFGQLGTLPSQLGSYGFAVAYDAFHKAKQFQKAVQSYRDAMPLPSDEKRRQQYETAHLSGLRVAEKKVKYLATEAANLLNDALDHSPLAQMERKVTFNEALHSDAAKRFKTQLEARAHQADAL